MSLRLPLDPHALANARHALLNHVAEILGIEVPPNPIFQSLNDGNMGSFAVTKIFDGEGVEQLRGEFDFTDIDGVGVLISVFSRDACAVSSFDFFRHDFEPLQSFPEPSELAKRSIADDSQDASSADS